MVAGSGFEPAAQHSECCVLPIAPPRNMRAENRSTIGNEIEFEQRKLNFLNSEKIPVAVKVEVI